MARKYHVLLVREDGNWTIDFGDYDIKAKDLYILTVNDDTQAEIDAAVKEFRQQQSVAAYGASAKE